MPRKILIIVDMQKDFLELWGKLYLGHDTSELIENVVNLAKTGTWTNVFATQDLHFEGDPETVVFGQHCMHNSEGQDLIDELQNIRMTKIDKQSYATTNLAQYLLQYGEDTEIWVCGVCTHICVHDIVGELYNMIKVHRGFIPKIIIPKDCIDDFDPEMAEFAIKRMETLYRVEVR